jgi:hypothetical protein
VEELPIFLKEKKGCGARISYHSMTFFFITMKKIPDLQNERLEITYKLYLG